LSHQGVYALAAQPILQAVDDFFTHRFVGYGFPKENAKTSDIVAGRNPIARAGRKLSALTGAKIGSRAYDRVA
jgi:hypothetical protein